MAGAGVGAVRRAGHTQIDMRDSEKCVGKSELEAGQKIRVPETNGCDAMCFWIVAGILLQFLFLRRSFSFRVVSQEIKHPLLIDQISVRVGEWRVPSGSRFGYTGAEMKLTQRKGTGWMVRYMKEG
ncbi:hypothetical protein IWW34DRAFT_780217 [Fusarium oxysporum f. sp. albedinis]|nr:hypothetical protein IWW34DRAFT_780217 [Fusarium oxysporum f. sp. albedinis]